jgi:putative FmdB family regulatory protein
MCRKCEEEFEVLVMRSDEEIECPKCEGADVERLLSVAAFNAGGKFKSSGSDDNCSGCAASSCSGCSSAT